MKAKDSKTVVFVTGAFVSHSTWDEWKEYFQSKGYKTVVQPWPGKEGTTAELRAKHPDPVLASVRLRQVIESYADVIKQQSEKPIVIGHSLGGLMTQILVNRDLAAAGIAIHPVPPQGVIPYEFSFLRGGGKSLGLFTSVNKTYMMSFKDWQYAFTNGMSLEDQQSSYEKYTIPESKRVARDGLTSAAHVDFSKPHAPLLIISGSTDTIIPASLNKRNFLRYKSNGSVTEYKEFKGKNHYVVGLPTWHEEADYILNWISMN